MVLRFEAHAEPIPGYRLIDRLGSGGFGEVWKCEAPGGIFKAVKIIHGDLRSKDDDLMRYAEQELKALKRVKLVRHPYLLALDRYDIVEGRLLIVMELADCNLWDRFRVHRQKGLPGIPRDELLLYMTETAEVLDLMNVDHQLLHLDIKPQNIFLQYSHVKVGDFGQVKDLEGLVASVTGGITPVYAAPETFDGVVTRYCDQYSLACVYQELLTGQRPFDGTSMQQLLMQHLAAPPNLQPTPPAERPALERALAKKPEDRWPSCKAFVNALKTGMPAGSEVSRPTDPRSGLSAGLFGGRPESPPPDTDPVELIAAAGSSLAVPVGGPIVFSDPRLTATDDDTPMPTDPDPVQEAPPEQTGPGPLRPTVIVAVGQLGLRTAQRLRKVMADRWGSAVRVPAVRTLFVDTDPDTLAAAVADKPADGLAALRPDEVLPARLNRPTHYHKPRLNGRTLAEGWFDPNLLNRLPRVPVTLGLRPLGRLAFCDHFRAIGQKLAGELAVAVEPEVLAESAANTGLAARTNRPRVYIVAGLAGGTGGGMFLDLAYLAKHHLRKLGYDEPDVVGLLFAPTAGATGATGAAADHPPQVLANTYAALTELHHYAHPDTVFTARYDGRPGVLRDAGPPFTGVYLLPTPPAAPVLPLTPTTGASGRVPMPARRTDGASGVVKSMTVRKLSSLLADDPTAAAADLLRLDLFGPVGRQADEARPTPADALPAVRAVGLSRVGWPRYEVIDQAARTLAGVVVEHWVSPDFGRANERVPEWVAAQLAAYGLAPDGLPAALKRAADVAAGGPVDVLLTRLTDPLVPKGWRARLPDPGQLLYTLDQIGRLVGSPGGRHGIVDAATQAAAADAVEAGTNGLTAAVGALVDDPRFRLAGTAEVIHELKDTADRHRAALLADVARAEHEARAGYELLTAAAHPAGTWKPAVAELAAALQTYPAAQLLAAVARQAARVFEHLKQLAAVLAAGLAGCRQKLQVLQKEIVADLERPPSPVGPKELMPAGCPNVADAAQKFLAVLTDDDLHQVEEWVQAGIVRQFGGMHEALLNSADGPAGILHALRTAARGYLDARLGEMDLAGMFEHRYGPNMGRIVAQTATDAVPAAVGAGPWAAVGFAVLGCPPGEAGEPLRRAADAALSDTSLWVADTPDELVVYREYPQVPLSALPHVGPAWEAAYQDAPDALQWPPHARTDVPRWVGVDS